MPFLKKLFLIYLLVFVVGLIIGWTIVSLDEYLKWTKYSSHPTFWQIFKL